MAVSIEFIEERLKAYILPRTVKTAAQREAFDAAVEAQAAWEDTTGTGDLPPGVRSVSVGDYAVTLAADVSAAPPWLRDAICPVAWAYLRNAGLIAYALPTARRP